MQASPKGPKIFWDDEWNFICGAGFWDNDIGASLACSKRGFEKGTVIRSTDQERGEKSLRVGKCNQGDTWPNCTGGCNDYKLGGRCSNDEEKKCGTEANSMFLNCTGEKNSTVANAAKCSCTYTHKQKTCF